MRRRPFLQVLSITFGIALTQSSQLSPRKKYTPGAYDPYMICDLPGPTHAEGLPAEYREEVYAELISLCSLAHGARQNVGCFCSTPNGRVHCNHHIADQSLWQANYFPTDDDVIHQLELEGYMNGEVTFPEYCQEGCNCVSESNADLWFEQTLGGADFDIFKGISGLNQPAEPPRPAGNRGNTFGAASMNLKDPVWQNQCGNNCTTAQDCSTPAGSNSTCTCQAHSSQYQPGSGTVAFIAACLVTLASPGGKRQEALPCPCNSTYVSHGCCDVSDGLVWEPPDSSLGMLLTSSGLVNYIESHTS